MIITTAPIVDGHQIAQYLGVVSAAQIMVMPGGNKGVQRGWQAGVEGTTAILAEQAGALGANAVVGVSYQAFGMNICATGTAVRLS